MDEDYLLTDRDVARLLGRARSTLQKDRVRGVAGDAASIPFVRVGRLVRYRRKDIDEWIERQRRRSTSDLGDVA